MRMSHAAMYARVLESDAACNGRFFTGVLTTGIYCLPSCKARKPKSENVRFFPTVEAARGAGLRPCKKCHPDDFARGADPILEDIETLVSEIRATPEKFPDTRAVVRRSGFGATRLFELFRQHYHATPADVLLRARLDAAKHRLLNGTDVAPGGTGPASAASGGDGRKPAPPPSRRDDSIAAVAHAVGFESLSVLHEHFRRVTGMTPAGYRGLRDATDFTIALPAGYPLGYLRRALSRDTQSVSEKLEGEHYTAAIRLSSGPARLELRIGSDMVVARVQPVTAAPTGAPPPVVEAHAIVVGLLGLEQDAAAFARLARKLGLARLVAGRPEMRIAQTPSVYDGLLWSILGQQINFAFACQLKRRLIERVGQPLADGSGLIASPTPAVVAALEPNDLVPLKFSRQKADYVISISRLIAGGKLDLESLRGMSATRAERTLLAIRGLGPWSVNYLMMRALGFADCVPLGDTGVTSGLLELLKLEERPDIDATRRLMAIFSPYRSLATAHLWQFNKPIA